MMSEDLAYSRMYDYEQIRNKRLRAGEDQKGSYYQGMIDGIQEVISGESQ